MGGNASVVILLLLAVYLLLSVLTAVLPVYSIWVGWKKWISRKQPKEGIEEK